MSSGVRDILSHLLVLGKPHSDSAETVCHSQTWGHLQKVSPKHDSHTHFPSNQGFISLCEQRRFTWLKYAFELNKGFSHKKTLNKRECEACKLGQAVTQSQ